MVEISLICATYNRFHLLIEVLDCLRNQNFQDWECIVIDDESTDNTYEKLISADLDSRFKVVNRNTQYKKGLSGCRNYGLKLARGNYIMFIDDDDLVPNNYLEIAYKSIVKKDLDFIHFQKKSFRDSKDLPNLNSTQAEVIYGESINMNSLSRHLWGNLSLASCTMIIKRSCFSKNQFHEKIGYAEEWNLYGKFIVNGFQGNCIENILYYNRKHEESNTGRFFSGNSEMISSYEYAHYDLLKYIIKHKRNINQIQYLKSLIYFVIKSEKNNFKETINFIKRKEFIYYLIVQCYLMFQRNE
jgi:GalNAc5-diNAcBac-PP-undecaprenol beta-1,3-glucosyltransferase